MPIALLLLGLAFAAVLDRASGAWVRLLRSTWEANGTREDRRIAVEERRIALEERKHAPRAAAQPMPDDLRHRIASLEEDWAQEDQERLIWSLYAECDDWDKVRQQLPPLRAGSLDSVFTAPAEEFVR